MLSLALAISLVPEPGPCQDWYKPFFLEQVGVTRAEWAAGCGDRRRAKTYFKQRWDENARRTPAEREERLVRLFLDADVRKLAKEEKRALLAVQPDRLPEELREPYAALKREIGDLKSGIPPGRRPKRSTTCSPDEAVKSKAQLAALRAGFEEIKWQECEWLRTTIECNYEEMEKHFVFKLAYDCEEDAYRCFLKPGEAILVYVAQYRKGARTRNDLVGDAFFGLGTRVVSCRRKMLD